MLKSLFNEMSLGITLDGNPKQGKKIVEYTWVKHKY